MENMEFYNSHYLMVDGLGCITDGWSDGPHPERDTSSATLLTNKGSYQFRLYPDGVENPALTDEYGVPLYKLDGNYPVKRTQEEIKADRAENPNDPTAPSTVDSVWDALDKAYTEGYREGVNTAYDNQ